MRTNLLLLLLLLMQVSYSQLDDLSGFYNQELENNLKAPISPEAAAFMKYGDVSVNMYTGTPNVNVPIYSHQGIEMNLPISLNYDAQGIKVEEMASWTGLKFNLVAGGRISRISNGLPDDYISGGLNTFLTNNTFRQNSLDLLGAQTFNSAQEVGDYFTLLKNYSEGRNDMYPDYYSINAPGVNGYATFNLNTLELLFLDDLKTQVSYTMIGNSINEITVTSPDGTVYVFGGEGAKEITRNVNYNDTGAGSGAGTTEMVTSWLLKRIESPNKKDIYEFNYFPAITWDDSFRAAPATHVVNPYVQSSLSTPGTIEYEIAAAQVSNYGEEHTIGQLFLSNITHNGRLFMENTLTSRADVSTQDLAALDSIKIYNWCETETAEGNCASELLFTATFDYGYFGINEDLVNDPTTVPYYDIRLKLNSVNFLGKDNVRYQQYRMEYENPDALPSRVDLGQDYLGFFNDQDNSVLYPALTTARGDFLPGGNREVNPAVITTGMLKRMYYPTGGFTEFQFEAHQIPDGLSPEVESYVATAVGSSASSTNIGNCADKYTPEGGAVVRSSVVTITGGTYTINFTANTGDAEYHLIRLVDPASPVEFVDICNGNVSTSSFVLSDTTGAPINTMRTLSSGTYQLMAVVAGFPDDNLARLTVSREVNVPIESPKAGVRIAKVTDYTEENVVARTKNYNYILEDGTPSGELVNDPILSYVTNQRVEYAAGPTIQVPTIHRLTNASGAGEPHVAYSRIEEEISDSGKTIITYNVGATGVMSQATPPQLNYYRTNISFANPTSTKVYTQDNLLLSESATSYFAAPTRLLTGQGTQLSTQRNYQYIVATDQGDGTFAVSFVDCSWACFGGSSVCTPTPHPPLICDDPNSTCFERDFAKYETISRSARGQIGGPSVVISTQYPDPSNQLKKIVTTTETTYDEVVDYLPRETKITDSEGNVQIAISSYPKDNLDLTHQSLVTNNKLNTVVKTEQFEQRDGIIQKTSERFSKFFNPLAASESNKIDMPFELYTAKEDDPLELRVLYDYGHNSKGNLTDIEQDRGIPTAALWGYDESRMIAKVDNAEFRKEGAEVTSTGAQAITQALFEFISYTELQNLTGDALRSVLDQALRNNPKFTGMVTTYTHKPQVGITTMTDTRGYTIFYEYDEFNRLKAVRDADGHLLNSNEYNYQTQQ